MKDTILVKKNSKGYKLTRTLTEDIDQKNLEERIKKVEGEIEAYTDTVENLETNKEEILKQQSEKIDNDIKAYRNALENLNGNLQALKDAMVLGQGKATSIQKGDTHKGVN
jgi:DNA repair exonuclease SbcCD ATPase subunit